MSKIIQKKPKKKQEKREVNKGIDNSHIYRLEFT